MREASEKLVIDATIFIDKDEMKNIASIPEVAEAMKDVKAPPQPAYKPTDWRARRYSATREAQWQKRPIIDYVANKYKNDIIQAAKDLFNIPNGWKSTLFKDIKYRTEPKALQLAQTDDGWYAIYVQVIADLGSSEDSSSFLGRLADEFRAAHNADKIVKDDDTYTFQTTLTGFDSSLKEIDPYSGVKLSDTKIHGWDIADEPGYDKEIRSAFVDHLSWIISEIYPDARVREIRDDGRIVFTSSGPISDDPTEYSLSDVDA
ncbi:MAG: hypothetical protein QXU32_00980 [Nitrososphaerales archaeon]